MAQTNSATYCRTHLPRLHIHCLANEIMSLIFMLGTPPQYQVSPPHALPDLMECASHRPRQSYHRDNTRFETALTWMLCVTSVCTSWRNLAHADHSLWCQITILSSTNPLAIAYNIMRSGSLPLNIALVFSNDNPDAPFSLTGELYQCSDLRGTFTSSHALELLKPHVSRFRELSVKTSCRDDMNFILITLTTFPTASHLEQLNMVDIGECRYYAHSTVSETSQLFGGHLPSLKNAVMFGLPTPVYRNTDIKAHLSELYVSFDVFEEHDIASELKSILVRTASLSRLRVSSYAHLHSLNISGPIPLMSLTHLDLQFWNGDHLASIIDALVAPRIAYMSIDIGFGSHTALSRHLASPSSNMTGVLHSLRTLSIGHFPLSRRSLKDLFISLTGLEVLIIGNQPIYQTILFAKVLSRPFDYDEDGNPDMYCPKLYHVFWKNASIEEVRKFSQDRNKFHHPVSVLHVSDTCYASETDVEFLRTQGSSLQIHSILDLTH